MSDGAPSHTAKPVTVLIVYPWTSFWAMGENAGVESFFRSARAYVDHGHEVHVVMPTEARKPAVDQYHGMTLHRFPYPTDPMHEEPGPLRLLRRVERYMHYRGALTRAALDTAGHTRPDVAVAFGPHATPAARRVAAKLNVPNVTRLFGQALSLFIDANGRIRDRARYVVNFPEVIAFRTPCAALIVHDDGSCGDRVAKYFKVPDDRFFFWRDGVDFSVQPDEDRGARKVALGIPAHHVVIGSVGRLSPERELSRVIDAFAQLYDSNGALDLLFVGDGAMDEELRARAARAGLSERVHFAGAFPRQRMKHAYAAMDIVVSISPRTNMTNATLEAMAAGVPVVALDAGTTGSVVINDDTGVLVPSAAVDEVAAALRSVVDDASLRERLGRRARQFIESSFDTVEQRVAREVELVVRIAREKRP